MPITVPGYDALYAQAVAYLRNRFPGRDLSKTSFLGKLAAVLAGMMMGLHRSVLSADADAIPSSQSSSTALDRWATLLGLYSTTSGVYGRKSATVSQGMTITVTGERGITYSAGSTLVASDGVTKFELDEAATIAGSAPGTGTAYDSGGNLPSITATTKGIAGNLESGDILTWESPPAGSDGTCTVATVPTIPGTDRESNEALFLRIQDRLQTPPKGGVASDYRVWAEEADTRVVRAYAYPLRNGLGTCDVIITSAGSGTGRVPAYSLSTDLQALVDDYINGSATQEGRRPVGMEGVRVLVPYASAAVTNPSDRGLKIYARMVPSLDKYAFDWVDTAATYTVSSVAAGPPAQIALNTAPPASLTTAIAAGLKPRLQILSASATAVNPEVRAVAFTAPQTITLETPLPDGFVMPTGGVSERVYAGGPLVAQTAADLLAYVDSLGPSRLSGYADPMDLWEDTVSIARLTQIALDAVDEDGQRMSKNIISGGVTLSVGSNSAAATDVQAVDSYSLSCYGYSAVPVPEILCAARVVVTQ